ncbi:hypothetical protein INT46_002126 [Mucor plumbeus]|uniref:Homeobox domain-containing protein n=1 Tax=Mucor plumbeus TaxID=97098 RepID=A0A8H7VDT0_9FUNG|nr:hypothetical protein INT46_002126 [Mucor plumbeus]
MTESQESNINKDWQDLPPIDSMIEEETLQDTPEPTINESAFIEQEQTLSFIKKRIDFHSAMYHQYLMAVNQSILCMQPENAGSNLPKVSESSSSKFRVKPISGTGTITVVTKTTTTTTITGFPVVDDVNRKSGNMAQHVAQEMSCSSSSSNCPDNSNKDDDGDNNDDGNDDLNDSVDSNSEIENMPSSQNNESIETPGKPDKRSFSDLSSQEESNKPSSFTKQTKPNISKITFRLNTPIERQSKILLSKNKRTTTSYDAKTTAYLKKIFFNYYSKQYKLTKEQRDVVIDNTGLRSRNVTYWFSNHKRRLGAELQIYRNAVREYDIKNYDEFLQWRRDHDLPEQITREEIKQYKTSNPINDSDNQNMI